MRLSPFWIAKYSNYVAHGKTIHEVMRDAQHKFYMNTTLNKRIDDFISTHKLDEKYLNEDFYLWYTRLIGSCEFGRKEFMRLNNIKLEDSMTTKEFLSLTRDSYNGYIIQIVEQKYEELKNEN